MTESQIISLGQVDYYIRRTGKCHLQSSDIDALVMLRLLNRTRQATSYDDWVYPLTLTPKGRDVLEGKS